MSRVSRVNVAVTASTEQLEVGLARARNKLTQFSQDTARMREQGEKLKQLGSNILGGAAGIAILSAPFRVATGWVEQLADASERASKAIDEFKKTGRSLSDQGFAPAMAADLAGRKAAMDALRARSGTVGAVFAAEASRGGEGSYLDSFVTGARGTAAFAGSMLNSFTGGPSDFMVAPGQTKSPAMQRAVGAFLESTARNDQEANYWTARRAATDPIARQQFELMRKLLWSP
jgi:hypothetical protein